MPPTRAFLLASCVLPHAAAVGGVATSYSAVFTSRPALPALSSANAVGAGHSHCNNTFNPSYLPPSSDGAFGGGIIVRLNACDRAPAGEHLGFAPCDLATGVCGDVDPSWHFALADDQQQTEDPRALFYDGKYYLFYYAAKAPATPTCDPAQDAECAVPLASSATPWNGSSWQAIGTYPWHRNGCCMMAPRGQKSYCIWGEGPGPFPGLGISVTTDIDGGVFTQVPWAAPPAGAVSPRTADGQWLLPLGAAEQEIKLEAGTHGVRLSTGDWVHFYAAATPGWVDNGNYTAGFLVLDRDDPTQVVQRVSGQWMIPEHEFETLCAAPPTNPTPAPPTPPTPPTPPAPAPTPAPAPSSDCAFTPNTDYAKTAAGAYYRKVRARDECGTRRVCCAAQRRRPSSRRRPFSHTTTTTTTTSSPAFFLSFLLFVPSLLRAAHGTRYRGAGRRGRHPGLLRPVPRRRPRQVRRRHVARPGVLPQERGAAGRRHRRQAGRVQLPPQRQRHAAPAAPTAAARGRRDRRRRARRRGLPVPRRAQARHLPVLGHAARRRQVPALLGGRRRQRRHWRRPVQGLMDGVGCLSEETQPCPAPAT